MPAADYRILTDATGQRIATALEGMPDLSGLVTANTRIATAIESLSDLVEVNEKIVEAILYSGGGGGGSPYFRWESEATVS